MIVIGITGAMASGKTTLTDIYRVFGATVVDTDKAARAVAQYDEVKNELKDTFGKDVFDCVGDLDRRALGDIAFAHPAKLAALNKIMLPRIIDIISEYLKYYEMKLSKKDVIVIDAALLF